MPITPTLYCCDRELPHPPSVTAAAAAAAAVATRQGYTHASKTNQPNLILKKSRQVNSQSNDKRAYLAIYQPQQATNVQNKSNKPQHQPINPTKKKINLKTTQLQSQT